MLLQRRKRRRGLFCGQLTVIYLPFLQQELGFYLFIFNTSRPNTNFQHRSPAPSPIAFTCNLIYELKHLRGTWLKHREKVWNLHLKLEKVWNLLSWGFYLWGSVPQVHKYIEILQDSLIIAKEIDCGSPEKKEVIKIMYAWEVLLLGWGNSWLVSIVGKTIGAFNQSTIQ